MNATADSKTTLEFLGAKLYANRIRADPELLSDHNAILSNGGIALFNFTRGERESFTFPNRLKTLSMDNAVLGNNPKSLLFTMVKNRFSRLFGHQPVKFSTLQS